MKILSIDIGGTYSRAAIFAGDAVESLQMLSAHPVKVRTSAFDSFQALMDHCLQQCPVQDSDDVSMVLGVPGPVENNRYALLANVAWKEADVNQLRNMPGECFLINDFVAQAFACLSPQMNTLLIKPGSRSATQGFCVVGAGTGLGHAALQVVDGRYQVIPSEAGHAAFAFDVTEMDYQQFVTTKKALQQDYAVNDQIVSGSGLLLLHEFLTGDIIAPEDIPQHILPDSKTAHYFARLYARSCRNYVLSLLDTCNTLYITGGVALNSPFLVSNDSFRAAFIHSSAKSSILKSIPVILNQSDFMGLWGGALYGLLQQQNKLYPA